MSFSLEALKVRSRGEIPGKFNRLVEAARGLAARRGVGIRLSHTPDGTVVSVDAVGGGGAVFNHPFQVRKARGGVQVRFGVLDHVEPAIGGKPISGGMADEPPVLEMEFPDGRQYVVLEVRLDKDLAVAEGEELKVAVTAELKSEFTADTGEYVARHPLALLETKGGVTRIFQIEYFNLSRRSLRKESGMVQHFFYAQ